MLKGQRELCAKEQVELYVNMTANCMATWENKKQYLRIMTSNYRIIDIVIEMYDIVGHMSRYDLYDMLTGEVYGHACRLRDEILLDWFDGYDGNLRQLPRNSSDACDCYDEKEVM